MTHEFSHLRAGGAGGGIVADPAARPEAIEADAIVTFLTEGGIGSGAVAEIDRATGGLLSRLAAALAPRLEHHHHHHAVLVLLDER